MALSLRSRTMLPSGPSRLTVTISLMPSRADQVCLTVCTPRTELTCQGRLRPSSGVMVLWMSALVSIEMSVSTVWVRIASARSDSM